MGQVFFPIVLAIAVGVLFLSVGTQILVGKTIKVALLNDHHLVIDALLGVVGTLYSVLLGFMVGGAMDRYEDCISTVDQEANSVRDVFRLAQGLETNDRVRIRNLCRDYVLFVTEKEWKEMKEDKPVKSAQSNYRELWEAALAIQPGKDERINNIQQELLGTVTALGEARRLRIVEAQKTLTFAQWLVSIVGGLITILFCYFFPLNRARYHLYLTSLVALTLCMNIWLLWAYSTPFAGAFEIQPYIFSIRGDKVFDMPDVPSRYLN